jgi:hypothetical protein
MLLLSGAKDLHADLSPVQREFLEFVERTPECLRRASFGALEHRERLYEFPMQPWPTFVGGAHLREMERISTGLCSLIKSLPERLFSYDPRRLAAFYGLSESTAEQIVRAMRDQAAGSSVLARGDFIDTPAGLQCLEFNICGNVGGWQSALWAERYLRVPLVAEFLGSLACRVHSRDTLQLFLAHALVTMQAREARAVGPFNLAVLALPAYPGAAAMEMYLSLQYRLTLERHAPGAEGRVFLCDYSDLTEKDGNLWCGCKRVHGVLDQYRNQFSPEVAECFARGGASFFDGPLRLVLDDKRNLALLSVNQDEEVFDDEERALLRSVLPWTRQVIPGHTVFRGERIFLPDFLARCRRTLVLKQAKGYGGEEVHLGHAATPAVWEDLVRRALEGGDWIAQELVESKPYLYQTDAEGCAPHDVIWGLFVVGVRYGGAFLRMQPKDRGTIVNSARGATEGVVFEVEAGPSSARS